MAFGYLPLCMLLLALFLQLPVSKHRSLRAATGLLLTIFMLATHPRTYASDNQVLGLSLACVCAEIAWTILHWSLLELLHTQPSVLEVLLSPIQHIGYGVRKGYLRSMRMRDSAAQARHQAKAVCRKQGAKRPPVVTDAARDTAAAAADHGFNAIVERQQTCHAANIKSTDSQLRAHGVFEVAQRLLMICMLYDLVQYTLCSVSGMCDVSTGSTNSAKLFAPMLGAPGATAVPVAWFLRVQRIGFEAVVYLQLCVFSVVAALLMGLMVEIEYHCILLSLSILAFKSPGACQFASKLPRHAFNKPWASVTLTELWAFRWHQFLRFYFEGLGYSAADALMPKGAAASPGLRASLHLAAAFCMSGLTHEYLIWGAFGRVTGYYMAFFGVHCLGVLLEGWAAGVVNVRSTAVKRCWTWAVCVLSAPLFFAPLRAAGVYSRCPFNPFGVANAPAAVGWLERLPRQVEGQLGFAADVLFGPGMLSA